MGWLDDIFSSFSGDDSGVSKTKRDKQKEKDTKELEGDERQSALRFQEQCYLMLDWEKVVTANKAGRVYDQFAVLEHDKPFELIGKLFKSNKNPELLFNLNSAQLSLLVPKIRLYKEYINSNNGSSVTIELPFDDYTRKDIISDITSTGVGRGGGVGLKSFNWKTLGTNPANRYSFGASLVLHFQNIEELFEIRRTEVLSEAKGETINVAYSDLILPQKKFREGENEGSFTYNKDYFRIKAVVGWEVPRAIGDAGRLFTKEELEEIRSNNISMYLGLKNHEIDMQDDGSVDLTVNYIAYTESAISDPRVANILFADAKLEKEKKRLAKGIKYLEDKIKREENKDQTDSEVIELMKKTIKEKEDRVSNIANQTKDVIYRRIMSSLLDKDSLYFINAPKDYFEKRIKVKSLPEILTEEDVRSVNDFSEDVKSRNKEDRPAKVTSREGPFKTVGEVDVELNDKTIDFEERYTSFVENVKKLSEFDEDKFEESGKLYRVDFFYLGDLIDVVLEGVFDKKDSQSGDFFGKDVRVITGPITFYDFGQLVDSGLVIKTKGLKNEKYSYDKVYTGKKTTINIADIPISLKVFTSWFVENVIDPGNTNYSFKKFLDDVVNDLVIRALSGECIDFTPKQRARIMYKSFSVPENKLREEIFREKYKTIKQTRDGIVKKPGIRLELKDLEKAPFITKENKKDLEQSKVKFENYLLIYGTMEEPYELKSNYEEDLKRGIYHIFFGNEFGLTKKLGYKREDRPYLKEANIANNLLDKKGPAKVLREKYNCTIDMFGNNLFEPGSKVHITPSVIGSGKNDSKMLSKRAKILKDLGIGGYYDIIAVESKIESGLYSTTLDARWVAKGDGTVNVGDEEVSLIRGSNIASINYSNNVRILTGG